MCGYFKTARYAGLGHVSAQRYAAVDWVEIERDEPHEAGQL